jgi:hypothetical protein
MGEQQIKRLINFIIWPSIVAVSLVTLALIGTLYLRSNPNVQLSAKSEMEEPLSQKEDNTTSGIVKGIHVATGLKDGEGLDLVITNCTGCHSAKMITQNRMSADRWKQTIQWMQRTQNLWDLGEKEAAIVSYLATYYAPVKKGRRQQLEDIEWYELALDKN